MGATQETITLAVARAIARAEKLKKVDDARSSLQECARRYVHYLRHASGNADIERAAADLLRAAEEMCAAEHAEVRPGVRW